MNKSINILFISSRADVGGGPLQMFDIISNIDRDKFAPFAVLPDEEPFYGRIASAGVKTLTIKKRAVSIFDFYELVKFVYLNNIDIVHSHGKGAGIYSRLLKFFCPCVKIVHTFHGFHYDNMPAAKLWLHKSVERLLSRLTDRFVSVSEGEQLQYALAGLLDFRKTVIIKNHVPLESLKRMESFIKQSKLSALNGDGMIYFCSAARFDPVKQMPFLVESFVKALNRTDLQGKLKLLLMGGGEEFETCRGLADKMNAGSSVEFFGEMPDSLEIMAKCDIYISASRREGLSMSMLEAAALGLPILAPRVSGIAELVRPYEKGIMFENNDFDSFERAIGLAVENFKKKWNVECPVENFAAKYEEHKEYIEKYEKLYTETLNCR